MGVNLSFLILFGITAFFDFLVFPFLIYKTENNFNVSITITGILF